MFFPSIPLTCTGTRLYCIATFEDGQTVNGPVTIVTVIPRVEGTFQTMILKHLYFSYYYTIDVTANPSTTANTVTISTTTDITTGNSIGDTTDSNTGNTTDRSIDSNNTDGSIGNNTGYNTGNGTMTGGKSSPFLTPVVHS